VGDYTDALAKDLKRIEAEMKQIDAALKKNPNDAAARKKAKAVMPFLEPASLDKRYRQAQKMDADAMRTQFKHLGF
jgi:hypothetical protein